MGKEQNMYKLLNILEKRRVSGTVEEDRET
jgi:hypothetical protein